MKKARLSEFWVKLLLFMAPFAALIAVYIVIDPFKVVRNYESYYPEKGVVVVMLNSDYVSTQNLLNKYKKNNYNAYIFGNSRSVPYRISDWEKYIGKQNCLHLNASEESIYGIEKKLSLIDRLGCRIDYAILVIDYGALINTKNSTGHLFEKHPVLSGENRFSFQLDFLETFFDAHYAPAFFDYLISGKYKNYMSHVMQQQYVTYSPVENETTFYYADSLIKTNPDEYYLLHKDVFYKRPEQEQVSPVSILEQQKILLNNIKNIFLKHGTKYKIIINPLYNQIRLNPDDIACLRSIFGESSVFDFSGVNAITSDYHNYYEASHYRPEIAAQIMDSVYGKARLGK